MKKYVLPLCCSVPFAFLSMYGDAVWGTMLIYAASAASILVLRRSVQRAERHLDCGIGCSCGLLISLLLSACVEAERWQWYFKPFSAEGWSVLLSLIVMAVMLLPGRCSA